MAWRAIALTLALALVPIGASAQGTQRERAAALVAKAQQAEREGRFLEAVQLHKDAYMVIPHPALVFNIAQAYRRAGNKRFAYFYYQRYLGLQAKGKLADISRKFSKEIVAELGAIDISEVEKELIANQVPEASKPKPPPPPPDPDAPGPGPAPEPEPEPEPPAPMMSAGGPIPAPAAPQSVDEYPADPYVTDYGPAPGYQSVSPFAARDYPQAIPFRGLSPVQPHGVIGIDSSLLVTEPGAQSHRIRVQLNPTSWLGLTGSWLLLSGPGMVETGMGNPELGLYVRGRPHLQNGRLTFMLFGSVMPELNTVDGDPVKDALTVRQLGDFNRLGHVSPDHTTFCMAALVGFETTHTFARLVAEINLAAGPGNRLTMGRFDGDIGARFGDLSVSAGSVTRVGKFIGQLAGTDDEVLQTVGGTLSWSLADHYRVQATAGVAIIDLSGEPVYLMLGLERDFLR